MRNCLCAAVACSLLLACSSESRFPPGGNARDSDSGASGKDARGPEDGLDVGVPADGLDLRPDRAESPGDRTLPDIVDVFPESAGDRTLPDIADVSPESPGDRTLPDMADVTPESAGDRTLPDMADVPTATDGALPEAIDARATGARFPFPQTGQSQYCVAPSGRQSNDVQAAYDLWKKATVKADGAGGYLRVNRVRDDQPGQEWTVSEGIGYGMILAVYMDDQGLFDNLWSYEQLWLNKNGLMDWKIDATGTTRLGTGAATDADEDMAWALVMADRQWGGKGMLRDTYLNFAKQMIKAIWDNEVDHTRAEMVKPGDSWGGSDVTNISYFAPAYYRVFGQVSGNVAGWNSVVDTCYAIITKSLAAQYGNDANGLVPAWCNSAGAPTVAYAGAPTHFQYDSCRTPFRIGLDFCFFDEPRARTYLDKISGFYDKIGARNIVDGYDLNGTPRPELSQNGAQAAAFVGPAGVGAMSNAVYQKLLEDSYALVASLQLIPGERYYNESWTVLSLLMMTGNFLNYAASP